MRRESKSQSCCSLCVRSVVSHRTILDSLMSSMMPSVLALNIRQFTAKRNVQVHQVPNLLSPMRIEVREFLDSSTHKERRFVDGEVSHVGDALGQLVLLDDVHVVIVVQLDSDLKTAFCAS